MTTPQFIQTHIVVARNPHWCLCQHVQISNAAIKLQTLGYLQQTDKIAFLSSILIIRIDKWAYIVNTNHSKLKNIYLKLEPFQSYR